MTLHTGVIYFKISDSYWLQAGMMSQTCVLLNKLKKFGIWGKLGEWLHSFLTNRRQHIRIPGGVSKSDNVLSGVPQGTVFGPVLFLVLISDISSNVSSNITSFADDTKVFAVNASVRNVVL